MGADAQTRADSFKIATKELGIWLNMNKQVNVESVLTADSAVAVEANLVQLLTKFAFDFGLGAFGSGPLADTQLVSTVKGAFADFGSFINTNILGAFSTTDDALINCWDEFTVAAATQPASNALTAALPDLTARGGTLATQATTAIQPKVDAITQWFTDLYDKNLLEGEGNFSLRMAYNTFNDPFIKTTKALGLEGLTLGTTISAAANYAGINSVNSSLQEVQALAANLANPNALVQAKLDEAESAATALFNEVTGNRLAMANAIATRRTFEETDAIYRNLTDARLRIERATAEGDLETVNDVTTWLNVYRSGLNTDLVAIVDQFIAINDEYQAGVFEPQDIAEVVRAAENPSQFVGDLPPARG